MLLFETIFCFIVEHLRYLNGGGAGGMCLGLKKMAYHRIKGLLKLGLGKGYGLIWCSG